MSVVHTATQSFPSDNSIMKKSSAIFVSGILAAGAMALVALYEIFVAFGFYFFIHDGSSKMLMSIGAMEDWANIVAWSLIAVAFAIIANKKNFWVVLVGSVSGTLLVWVSLSNWLSVNFNVMNMGHWFVPTARLLLFAAYAISFMRLRTAAATELRNLAIVAVWFIFLRSALYTGLSVFPEILKGDALEPLFMMACVPTLWAQILCWLVLCAFYVSMARAGKTGAKAFSRIRSACDVMCTACGNVVHFENNQMRVICVHCGVSVMRASGMCPPHEVPIRQAVVDGTIEVKCPNCDRECEAPDKIVEGQHLLCPYCGEKFSYMAERQTTGGAQWKK